MPLRSKPVDFDFRHLNMHDRHSKSAHGEHEALVKTHGRAEAATDEPPARSCLCCLACCCTCCEIAHARVFEMASVCFSFLCLIATLSWRIYDYDRGEALRQGDLPVRVSRETLLFSRNSTVMDGMRLLHSSWNGNCSGSKLLLQRPGWQENEAGLVMHANIDAGYFSIWWAALCVFVFSITFQSWRVMNFNGLYRPERGPEFSRWLEYFFTSPLQILIVSAAFGFATLDSLLGQSGMQAALVLLGYDIERQVKKVYKRKERHGAPKSKKFYHVLSGLGVRDLRLGVYLGFAWLLHFFIWGVPFLGWTPGIGGKYAQLRSQQEACPGNGKIPDEVQAIFWLQYTCFTLFGVVCTWQVGEALMVPHLTADDIQKRWNDVSKWYSFLSLTAKTLLEVGLALFVATYRSWKLENGVTVHPSWAAEHYRPLKLTNNMTVYNASGTNSTCWVLKPVPGTAEPGSQFRGDVLGVVLLCATFIASCVLCICNCRRRQAVAS